MSSSSSVLIQTSLAFPSAFQGPSVSASLFSEDNSVLLVPRPVVISLSITSTHLASGCPGSVPRPAPASEAQPQGSHCLPLPLLVFPRPSLHRSPLSCILLTPSSFGDGVDSASSPHCQHTGLSYCRLISAVLPSVVTAMW